MKIHLCVATLGKQDMVDRLFSNRLWRSIFNQVEMIVMVSQLKSVEIPQPNWVGGSYRIMQRVTARNLGCAGARQWMVDYLMAQGLGRDDVIIFLDDDVIVKHVDWLEALVEPLRGEYSISGFDGRDVTPDYLTVTCRDIHPQYLSGGWCAIRGDVFLDGVKFDETFNPCYYEDVDIGFQCQQLGKKMIKVENAGYLEHLHPANSQMAELVMVNREKFRAKWRL